MALAVALASAGACVPATTPGGEDGPDGSADGGGADAGQLPERTCFPGDAGVTGSPHTIGEAVALVNSLPRPVTVPCLLESLDRPLRVDATLGIMSAQPAAGARSPRLFLFIGPLVVSVVAEGRGAEVVEFAEARDGGMSVKGEIPFPVAEPLPPEAPFTQVMFQPNLTSCALCHPGEVPDAVVGTAQSYASAAFRPLNTERVPVAQLRGEWQACDRAAEPSRCAFYDALFSFGPVEQHAFPQELRTFVRE